jgi:hypothetical protein
MMHEGVSARGVERFGMFAGPAASADILGPATIRIAIADE